MSIADFLIVGLGNPGAKYEKTRHNLGFMVLKAFAKKHAFVFKRGWRLKGQLASGLFEEKKVHLLMPTTYMNLSGQSVQRGRHYFKISLSSLLIVVDDVYLGLGSMRLRSKGSAGGHNGLKSVEESMRTQDYSRLRMGVGGDSLSEKSLEAFVLSPFETQEWQQLPEVLDAGVSVIERWITQGIKPAVQLAGELSK